MTLTFNLSIFLTILALITFMFVYWRDATREGYGSDKIIDSFFVILLGSFLGGKLLFRSISFDYIRYGILYSPLIFEGVLIGGGIAFLLIAKKNRWDIWKLGDMIAPAIAISQSILFLGLYTSTSSTPYLISALAFLILYIFLRYLKKKKYFGSSFRFFELKRLNKPVVSGMLMTLYLTGSSLIAILFLGLGANLDSKFWRFQLIFYLLMLAFSYFLIRKRISSKDIKVTPKKTISNFQSKMKSTLSKRFRRIQNDKKLVEEQNPFMQEAKSDGFRNLDEHGDEAADLGEYKRVQAVKDQIKNEEKELKNAIKKIEQGKYGYCTNCGKKIDPKRLEIYPTAELCIDCEKDKEEAQKMPVS